MLVTKVAVCVEEPGWAPPRAVSVPSWEDGSDPCGFGLSAAVETRPCVVLSLLKPWDMRFHQGSVTNRGCKGVGGAVSQGGHVAALHAQVELRLLKAV